MSQKKKTKGSKQKLASRLAKLEKTLEVAIDAKQVYEDGSALLTTDYVDELLGDLTQGSADTGTPAQGAREGNSISCQSISCKMILDGEVFAATASNPLGKSGGYVRVMIVNSPFGRPLGVADVLQNSSSDTRKIVSHYKVAVTNSQNKYEIWYDKTFCLSDAKSSYAINFRKRWKHGKKITYDDNAALPNNFRPRLIVVMGPGGPAVSGNTFNYESKMRFIDL